MQKIFLKYHEQLQGYYNFDSSQTCNFILQDLFFFLIDMHDNNLRLSSLPNKVILWDSDNIKQKADLQFETLEEKRAFDQAYSQYSAKRWYDMPILEMSLQNYEIIAQKWNNILKIKPKYIILSQDDAGYVDLVGKDELSQQDLADMKHEHGKYLKYQAAYDKYTKSRPDIVDELWHGPESSEYEADWQKFLDEPLD